MAVFGALLLASLINTALAWVQYFTPALADGTFIAKPTTPGRAFGNLRQPNQLATLLLLGVCCLPVLAATRTASHAAAWRWAWAIQSVLLLGVALSGSRTGMLGVVFVSAWAAIDRGMRPEVRRLLVSAVPIFIAWWLLLWAWGHLGGTTYFGEARLETNGDISSSRFKIWSNTLALIAAHPWTGVGWGEFNFAWTLTEFPDRPIAFFDHTHNLVLQLAVELGIPATLAILAVLMWALWRARGGLRDADPDRALTAHCSLMMVMLVLWHSLLEYPLWYPYFLFPTAFALGVYLRIGWPEKRAAGGAAVRALAISPLVFKVVGAVMVLGSLYAIWDYQRIVQIFSPYGAAGQRPLHERIQRGQQSHLFGHHADYAAVTTAAHPSEVFDAFERPLHNLIDARLMIAYAKALAERGETGQGHLRGPTPA